MLTSMEKEVGVLYEDENILVVDKPSGMLTHPNGFDKNPSLHDWLETQYPGLRDVGEPIKISPDRSVERFGLAHRLDKDTSGVLLIAKNQETFLYFKRQFKDRQIQKLYYGFVYGCPSRPRGLIDKSIGRSTKGSNRRAAGGQARGLLREAKTTYVVEACSSGVSLLRLIPQTGRTHQLRVHCQWMGHPIVADPIYARSRKPVLNFKRLALHADSLTFTLPETGQKLSVTAPWPDDFIQAKTLITG